MNYHIKSFESFENIEECSIDDLIQRGKIDNFGIGGIGGPHNLNASTKPEDFLRVHFLNVRSKKLTSLKGIEKFPNLTYLNAHDNLLTNMSGIENCQSLRELFVSKNQLTSLDHICLLKNLEELQISENLLEFLTNIEMLTKLKVLHVDNNKLISLSGVENLNLSEIYVEGNKLPHNNYIDFQQEAGEFRQIKKHLLENPYTRSKKVSTFNSRTGLLD